MAVDPFESNVLTLTPEQVAELAPLQKKRANSAKPRPRTLRATKFVMLPYEQTLAVAGQLGDAPLAVLVELSYLRFKRHQNPVPLPNTALRAAGITHWAKIRTLHRLEKAGLVTVIWRGRRCPLVTILWE